ncbi:zinc finger protein ZPR1-like [Branchiostoma floridae]|uniref:Zinc finger protein 259 n=1 Tax=Branchiostoma floridae TaxID=7739 RepID=A0A9J7KH41_BRAFL|nr:zinc finger protein ZPR1-like [Branchiostoma floridae]
MADTTDGVDASSDNKPLFRDLTGDIGDQEATQIDDTLCMNCHESGTTRLLMTRIPYFREVVLMSFDCPHCSFSNNELQPASTIQDQGVKVSLKVETSKDLNRQVVKAESASLFIPELDFEVPANTQKGVLTTVEGVIDRAVRGLEQEQPIRRTMDPGTAEKIDAFIEKLRGLTDLKTPFTLVLDDPTGNSFVENPFAPSQDKSVTLVHYPRTREQNIQIGLQPENEPSEEAPTAGEAAEDGEAENLADEVLCFNTNCPNCQSPVPTNMKVVDIPYFKQVIVMATTCDRCGHRSNEVKSASGVGEKGRRMTLNMTDPSDLTRDVLKSETCTVCIPELDFELSLSYGIGGKFTTLEGLIINIKEQLEKNAFSLGDSSTATDNNKMKDFLAKLAEIAEGKTLVHIVLDDPAGNSYIQNVYAPDPDPELVVEDYERNQEQNEDLGLNQMKTENYEEDN